MFRKTYFTFLLTAAILLTGAAAAFAQTGEPVRGKVFMTKDGVKTPVADARVDAYRVDGSGSMPTKTNKKGEFQFAGFLLGQTYHLAVSGPGLQPQVYPKVKSGMATIEIEVAAGAGNVLTEAEVKQLANSALPAQGEQLTAEQKKEIEEINKKNAEIEAKNKKTQAGDEIVARTFKEGNEALNAKNYDVAIAKYTEGITAVPDFVGSTPLLLSKKVIALKERALKTWKEGAANGVAVEVKLQKNEEAKKDYNEALAAFNRAMQIVKANQTDAASQKSRDLVKTELYANAIDVHRLMSRTSVDNTKSDEAKLVFDEYFAFETDAAKRAQNNMVLADILRQNGDCVAAAAQYKKVLEGKPEDPDALAGAGLCMFNEGIASNDKAVMQEGLNLMEHFTKVAPDTHELKASVKDAIEYLKTEQKMTAQKPATTRKKN